MELLEKVEKIKDKTGVSYEDAKAALEVSGGDILDALVWLETQGKIPKAGSNFNSTGQKTCDGNPSDAVYNAKDNNGYQNRETAGDAFKRFIAWCSDMIQKGCENFFIVSRKNEDIITLPVIVLVLCLIFAFWVILPLMVIGLFFGFRYSFKGRITRSVDVNSACDKAAEAAEKVKQEFTK